MARDSRFWTWLQNNSPYPKSLAWCHNTDGWALRELFESGFFTPRPCSVFREDLLYFFYGRPAYRHTENAPLRISGRAPVALILDPDLIAHGKRLFPFDSGAFADKRYANWMHPKMQLADFEMACPSDAPQRHVASFFGSNSAYLRLRGQRPSASLAGEFEVDSLLALLTDQSIEHADDRRVSIELQVAAPVPLRHPTLLAMILPDELMNAPFIQSFRAGPGSEVDMLFYPLSPLKKGTDYQVPIEERAMELQESWGWG